MLDDLAESEGKSVSDYVHDHVRQNHAEAFILTDVTPPPRRTGLHLPQVLAQLADLERKGVVERVDGQGANSTWEPKGGSLEKTSRATAAPRVVQFSTDTSSGSVRRSVHPWAGAFAAERRRRLAVRNGQLWEPGAGFSLQS
jgi:hypothetical protein